MMDEKMETKHLIRRKVLQWRCTLESSNASVSDIVEL